MTGAQQPSSSLCFTFPTLFTFSQAVVAQILRNLTCMRMYDMLSWQPVVQWRTGNENHYYHHMVPFTRFHNLERYLYYLLSALFSLPMLLCITPKWRSACPSVESSQELVETPLRRKERCIPKIWHSPICPKQLNWNTRIHGLNDNTLHTKYIKVLESLQNTIWLGVS